MRKSALLLIVAAYGYAANAQFTLRPQIGFEIPVTKISYNNSPYFRPAEQVLPQAGIRAEYAFKGGFGPYMSVSTHRPTVDYSFTNPETGAVNYSATAGNLQAQLQAGVQYSSKPLSLSGKSSKTPSAQKTTSATNSICSHF